MSNRMIGSIVRSLRMVRIADRTSRSICRRLDFESFHLVWDYRVYVVQRIDGECQLHERTIEAVCLSETYNILDRVAPLAGL